MKTLSFFSLLLAMQVASAGVLPTLAMNEPIFKQSEVGGSDLQTGIGAEKALPKAPIPLSAERKKKVIEKLGMELKAHYVFPELGDKLAAQLQKRFSKGEYDNVDNAMQFASLLTGQMQELSNDKHLNVFFNAESVSLEANKKELSEEELTKNRADELKFYKSLNYGIKRIERFDGNIGYLELIMFGPVKFVGKALSSAMVLLEGSDALIIDLRDNTGGSPEAVTYLVSHFFEQSIHLTDNYARADNSTRQTWSHAYLPSPRYDSKKPVYILTSKKTFSAAEDFSYTMQALKRATIVGEVTGGGAHAGIGRRLDENLLAFIPYQRAVNPITKTNWEGVGVNPDIAVDADKALVSVRLDILKRFLKNAKTPDERSEIVESILDLKTTLKKQQFSK